MDDSVCISFKAEVPERSVLPEEIRLIQAHLGELLVTMFMQSEEE